MYKKKKRQNRLARTKPKKESVQTTDQIFLLLREATDQIKDKQ
jgi:hypothetical protein